MKLKTVRLLCTLLLAAMLGCFLVNYFAKIGKALYYASAGFYIVFCFFYLGFWKCPHCGKHLGFGFTKKTHCPHCDKNLE